MLMIRLARFGAKKKPSYRVVVIEKERARNSRSVEVVGIYNPVSQPQVVNLNHERIAALDEERRAAIGHRQPAFEEQSRARASGHRLAPATTVVKQLLKRPGKGRYRRYKNQQITTTSGRGEPRTPNVRFSVCSRTRAPVLG